MSTQLSLLGGGEPSFDPALSKLRRIRLDATAWVELLPGFLRGHDALFARLQATPGWQAERRVMYDREVDVPRLTTRVDLASAPAVLADMVTAVERRVGVALPHVTMAFYRDGKDSVAWHRDRVLRDQPDSVMAIVSLGEPRRFLLRPLGGGTSKRFHLGWGDLLILGGTVQRTWEHCVPKLACAGPRISIMCRPTPRQSALYSGA